MRVKDMSDDILRGSAQSQLESVLKAWERRQIAQVIRGIHALSESLWEIHDRVQKPAPAPRPLDLDAPQRSMDSARGYEEPCGKCGHPVSMCEC